MKLEAVSAYRPICLRIAILTLTNIRRLFNIYYILRFLDEYSLFQPPPTITSLTAFELFLVIKVYENQTFKKSVRNL